MQKAIFSSHLLPFHLESITRSVLALYVGLERNLSTQRKLRLQYTSETTTLWCQDKKKWLYYINSCILHLLPFIKVDSYINKDIAKQILFSTLTVTCFIIKITITQWILQHFNSWTFKKWQFINEYKYKTIKFQGCLHSLTNTSRRTL